METKILQVNKIEESNANMQDTEESKVDMLNIQDREECNAHMQAREEINKDMDEQNEDNNWNDFLQDVSQCVYAEENDEDVLNMQDTEESNKDLNEQIDDSSRESWSSFLQEVSQFVSVVNSSFNNIKFEASLKKRIEEKEETGTKNVHKFHVGENDSTKLLVHIKIAADEVIPLLDRISSEREFNQLLIEDFSIQPLEDYLNQLKHSTICYNADSRIIDSFSFGFKELFCPTKDC